MDTYLPLTPSQVVMTNARMRAAAVGDLASTFHLFDASRFEWLAEQLRNADRHEIAVLADEWAREHRETADRLAGQVAA